jgi:alpha-1,2-glucosyltransferase
MNKWYILIFTSIFVVLFTALFLIRNTPLKVDERDHYPQIISYVNGDFSKPYVISTLTTYHALVAAISKITGIASISFFRTINLFFALIAIIIFGFTCFQLNNKTSILNILQFSFFPLIFPYFFLIYTDVLSLLMVLCAFLFFTRKKYQWCGIFSIFACLVRQDNIVWLSFFLVMSYIDRFGFKLKIKDASNHLIKYWSFSAGIVLFILFVIINKGIAIGDKSMHPAFSFHSGNIYFLLFIFFILFIPLHLANYKKIIALFKRHKLIIAGITFFYFLFLFSFSNDHPFNYQWGNYFLRNKLLIFFNASVINKTVFFILITYSILSLCVTEFKHKKFYLLYVFTFLFLIPSWLIEQRYYFIPLSLFLLFKKEEKKSVEISTTVLFVAASGFLFLMIRGNRYFL